jgi:hypothetical protein
MEIKSSKVEWVSFENEKFYKIANSDTMRPFFMSIVSDSNHWMFISSNGGLTAGRIDSDNALFPYYSDDKITEGFDITGSKTIFQIGVNSKTIVWEPFSIRQMGVYKTTRNVYKNNFGNKIIFEEINEDLNLTYRYQWSSSDRFGFVKKAALINNSQANYDISLLDGLQNILPNGINEDLQSSKSNLVDAYKKNELVANVGLGIYSLSAVIVDKAEPSECLKANIVWSFGLESPTYLISSLQLDTFRKGNSVKQEVDIKAEKGAYFINANITLEAQSENKWVFVANVNQTISDVVALSEVIKNEKELATLIQQDVELGTKNLISLTASSDGLQITEDELTNTRHFANTLFNIMRGGIFDDGYKIEKQDLVKYVAKANKNVSKRNHDVLQALPADFSLKVVKNMADTTQDTDFKRLCMEYLPLKFSRRHGDPSRPWNKFSINTRSEIDGSKILDYEGNWRDIFQNWEALAHSFPEFIESMIHKFLNASTFEGYNPYRVTKDGFDWEAIEEHDPWSYIGYWGDHQIIYLLKFLEIIESHFPHLLEKRFDENIFVYANVPYKIKSYQETLDNPKDTIDFNYKLDGEIRELRSKMGSDGALLLDANSTIYKVNLHEKLLVTLLAKVSNFIPEGGIWMNTQRPEWNDANNALVGNGVSMVTLSYLNRFILFYEKVTLNAAIENIELSEELAVFFNEVVATLKNNSDILATKISDQNRKSVLDGLGNAGSIYRTSIYKNGFKGLKTTITKKELLDFFDIVKVYLKQTIKANKRVDNMYHAYNLMTVKNDTEVSISHLPEMLEGQVAVLSSGLLSPKEALHVLDGLKSSALFREDQYSYILYPNKELPRFDKKNNIPAIKVEKSQLLVQLIKDANSEIVQKDVLGGYHFNGNFNNAKVLKTALSNLNQEKYKSLIDKDATLLAEMYEEVFVHKSFTGRSGTFFGYEGLGSIYWHMVSKLLLAVQENCLLAINTKEDEAVIGKLLDHYYEINAGIGVHKSPELYGAFPTDPYSHTPAGKGAQQPGMTGQVKEDILSRIGEVGVRVAEGKISFNTRLLRKNEFLKSPKTFNYINIDNDEAQIELDTNSLCFTYCQIPVIYKLSHSESLEVVFNDRTVGSFENLSLDIALSQLIFGRKSNINHIVVSLKK